MKFDQIPVLVLAACLSVCLTLAGPAAAGDDPVQPTPKKADPKKPVPKEDAPKKADAKDAKPAATELARKNAIRGLAKSIRKIARSPWAHKKTDEMTKHLEALGALGGKEAGAAALGAAAFPDKGVRDAAFDLAERERDKSLVKKLLALLEAKELRRDADVRRRVVHALAVMADTSAIEPLAELIRFDEDAGVVAEAADALAGFASAKISLRKPAVKRLVDLYEVTWNLKESVRTEHKDKLLRKTAQDRYKIYGKSLVFALQALTEVQLRRPAEWRRWWNSNKKASKWGRHSEMPKTRRDG